MAIKELVKSAAPERVLNLLQQLMHDQQFNKFYLVGGTSLALRLGHRMSIDIDLFVHEDFDAIEIGEKLYDQYYATAQENEKNTIRTLINNVKVDFIAHKYPLLQPLDNIDDIRMASLEDIAAMKINSISNRGSKKDFWDYAALLTCFTTEEMLSFFQAKYSGANAWHAERSLSFFDDAENEPDPKDLSNRTWQEIKRIITQSLKM